jgi:uncharacterized membrane protein
MLKSTSLLIFIGAIASISAIELQSSASAATVFCNKTNSPIRVAYARGIFDPTLSIETTTYDVKGWLKIAADTCITASTEPADKVDRSNGYDLVRHYYYAKSSNKKLTLTGETSPRKEKFCIKDINFKYSRELGDTSQKLKCESGYRQVSFSTFNSNTSNYTVLLTSPPSLTRK